MKLIKIILLLAFAASICNSQTINYNISGSVVDSAGKGIAGAKVQLEKAKVSAITDESGIFTIKSTTGIKSQIKLGTKNILNEPYIQKGQLNFCIAVPSVIDVAVFTIQGKLLSSVNKTFGMGTHVLDLPVLGRGLYLCRAKIGNAEYLLKETGLGQSGGRIVGRGMGKAQGGIAKQANMAATIDDVLFISKDGFLDDRTQISESVQEMSPIKMIANAGNVTDIDGNVYQSVRIGSQVWTTENLRVTRYRDGGEISLVSDNLTWNGIYYNTLTTPAYCYCNNTNNADTIKRYGALYNWYTVNTGNLAPTGWHVPSYAEWTVLEKYLVLHGYNYDGSTDISTNMIAKAIAAKTDWHTFGETITGLIDYDLTKNNSSGFSALPGGFRCNCVGSIDDGYADIGYLGSWWSATTDGADAWSRHLGTGHESLGGCDREKGCGLSVRLVKD